jgi:hypothetical protein
MVKPNFYMLRIAGCKTALNRGWYRRVQHPLVAEFLLALRCYVRKWNKSNSIHHLFGDELIMNLAPCNLYDVVDVPNVLEFNPVIYPETVLV